MRLSMECDAMFIGFLQNDSATFISVGLETSVFKSGSFNCCLHIKPLSHDMCSTLLPIPPPIYICAVQPATEGQPVCKKVDISMFGPSFPVDWKAC